MVTLLGDGSDIGVVRIFQLSLRGAGDEFQGRRGRAKHGAASGCSARARGRSSRSRATTCSRSRHRHAPVLRLVHRSLELLRQGPDLRKVRLQAQAQMR